MANLKRKRCAKKGATATANNLQQPVPRFLLFKKLPEHVRLRVWMFACFLPRVVELHEKYELEAQGAPYTTDTRSCTRPPALLYACSEARKFGLEIYINAYKHASSEKSVPWHTPIYLNPLVDITYRNRQSDPFRIFGPDFTMDVAPLGETRTLAVDSQILECDLMSKPRDTKPNMVYPLEPRRRGLRSSSIAEQIMACRRKGVKTVIFVIGNGEHLDEFELDEVHETSARVQMALERAINLRIALHKIWRRGGSTVSIEPPLIKLMSVKKKPPEEETFYLFSLFPPEIQNQIWDFASQSPRCIILEDQWNYVQVTNRHQPPLLSVCQASCSIALAKLTTLSETSRASRTWSEYDDDASEDANNSSGDIYSNLSVASPDENFEPGTFESPVGYFNQSIDILVLPYSLIEWKARLQVKEFAISGIERLAIYGTEHKITQALTTINRSTCESLVMPDSYFITAVLQGLKEVTLAFGKPRANCEMAISTVTEQSDLLVEKEVRKGVSFFVEMIENKLADEAPATYENVVVEIANLIPVTRTISPYSY